MPQLDAAKKALRVNQRQRVVNDRWRRKIRESLREVREALTAGDSKAADTAITSAESVLDRAAKRNIIHPNKAARKKSRLRSALSRITAK